MDWTGLTFCTNCIHDTKHVTVTSIQVVCCYFEEALQPPIRNPQKLLQSREGGGGGCRLECTHC